MHPRLMPRKMQFVLLRPARAVVCCVCLTACEWMPWQLCNVSCGGGQQVRSRSCWTGSDDENEPETRECNTEPCASASGMRESFLGPWFCNGLGVCGPMVPSPFVPRGIHLSVSMHLVCCFLTAASESPSERPSQSPSVSPRMFSCQWFGFVWNSFLHTCSCIIFCKRVLLKNIFFSLLH